MLAAAVSDHTGASAAASGHSADTDRYVLSAAAAAGSAQNLSYSARLCLSSKRLTRAPKARLFPRAAPTPTEASGTADSATAAGIMCIKSTGQALGNTYAVGVAGGGGGGAGRCKQKPKITTQSAAISTALNANTYTHTHAVAAPQLAPVSESLRAQATESAGDHSDGSTEEGGGISREARDGGGGECGGSGFWIRDASGQRRWIKAAMVRAALQPQNEPLKQKQHLKKHVGAPLKHASLQSHKNGHRATTGQPHKGVGASTLPPLSHLLHTLPPSRVPPPPPPPPPPQILPRSTVELLVGHIGSADAVASTDQRLPYSITAEARTYSETMKHRKNWWNRVTRNVTHDAARVLASIASTTKPAAPITYAAVASKTVLHRTLTSNGLCSTLSVEPERCAAMPWGVESKALAGAAEGMCTGSGASQAAATGRVHMRTKKVVTYSACRSHEILRDEILRVEAAREGSGAHAEGGQVSVRGAGFADALAAAHVSAAESDADERTKRARTTAA